jgi:hypothetical protein
MTTVINGDSPSITFSDSTTQTTAFTTNPTINNIKSQAATPLTFSINTTERMRIDSNGNLLVGQTAVGFANINGMSISNATNQNIINHNSAAVSGTAYIQFGFNGGGIGNILQSGTTAVSYNTSSDYRLKENIKPMTGALDKVAQLKPVTYKWKSDGSDGQGFIAHELQAVVPDCVTGEKDAVDAEGNIKPQGIDTSFLVATLTASIQELKAIVDAQAARIAALESAGT